MKLKEKLNTIISILAIVVLTTRAEAKITLPKIFSSNMVVQRDQKLSVHGWTDSKQTLTLSFNSQQLQTKADKKGCWQVEFASMGFGGPYVLNIRSGNDSVVLNNIMVGDVWFCSGQSNMEMPVEGWGKINDYQKEVEAANHPDIRFFTVEKAMSFNPESDLKGGEWQVCSSQTLGSFSATAYFFGRKLNQELGVPIGLINASWGGTNIQTWISEDAICKIDAYNGLDQRQNQKTAATWEINRKKYQKALGQDPGTLEKWFATGYDFNSWDKMQLPQVFEHSQLGNVDGIIWFRKEIDLIDLPLEGLATISLGAIDDYDEVYINGIQVGASNEYYIFRKYSFDLHLLHKGKNSITIKVTDTGGMGGFTGASCDMSLAIGKFLIPLNGEWKYKPAVTTTQYNIKETGPNAFPSLLYNAMVAPLVEYPIKGTIWYQGEENTNYPQNYDTLFLTLIDNWRNKWNNQSPFIWVQLANYMAPDSLPSESNYALIRDYQHQALKMANTGEAVAIDLGEANDIHPKNKQEVGYRLALNALKIAYGHELTCSGPVFKSATTQSDQIIITFDNIAGGLVAKNDKYGFVRGFAIAGEDMMFQWAQAYISGDQVIVLNKDIKNPVVVRYAWGNNPDDANLYNFAGLPASPFKFKL